MIVWLSVIAFSLIVSSIGMTSYVSKTNISVISENNTNVENFRTVNFFFALLSFALLIFFVGQRSWIFDTANYARVFTEKFSGDLGQISDVINKDLPQYKGKGYCILLIIFKHFVSQDYNAWFTFIVLIQCIGIAKFFSRYSSNFSYSIFLFYTTSCFLWTVNGTRQFLAATIILMFSNYLVERKTIPFIIIVLIAYSVHTSALIMIPAYFCVNYEPWSKKSNIFLAVFMGLLLVYVFRFSSNDSEYSYITGDEYSGVNILRVVVMSIPAILCFIKFKTIAEVAPKQIGILINLSIMCCGCFVLGAFTNGMVARIALYFQIYTYVLLPWILKYAFEDNKIIKTAISFLLIAYFYYDMIIAGNGIYQSANLGIY